MTQSATLLLFTRRQSQSPRPVDKPARAGHQLPRQQQAAGRRNAGLHRRTLLSPAHAIHPLLRPAMEELFEEFQPAFLANAAYRFRNRTQFWPISAHNHLLLKSDRARVVKPSDSAHFSVRYCLTASPDAIEARLKQLADGTTRMTCINYLEVVTAKCPIRCAISRRRLGRTRPSKSPIMGATDRAGESGRLPGSDRRYRRACAICSRNRVTAVMRKQLQGQFVRQAPFCSWLGGPQFGGGLSRCKVFRGAAASARDELRRITSRRRPLARNNSKPSDRTASDWQDDRPREGAV
jgi:hypothetical protein